MRMKKLKGNQMKAERLEIIKKVRGLKEVLCGMILVGCIFLSACGTHAHAAADDSALSVKETVECAMESMKTVDLERFNACTDNYIQTEYNWIGVPIRSEYRVFSELLQPGIKLGKGKEKYEFHYELYEEMMKNLTWEIKNVEEDGNKAEITMEITNLDMNGVMGKYEMSILENMIASNGTGLGQMIKDLSQIMDEDGLIAIIKACDKDERCTFDVTATAYRENDTWVIHLDEELLNACMGNINAEEYSEEMQQKIKELEKAEEEKLTEWEQEFTEDVENWVNGLFGE